MPIKKGKQGAPKTGIRSANNQPVVITTTTLQPVAFRPQVQTFPNVMRCSMRYAWAGAISTAAGGSVVQLFRLNSLYDPDETGAGAQPKYFDTLCGASGSTAPYSYYRVRRTHFRANFTNPNSTASTSSYAFCQVYASNPMSTTATISDMYETVNCRAAVLGTNGNNNSVVNFEGSVDHGALWAVKDWEDDEDFLAAYNANPSAVSHLQVGVRAMDDTTTATMRVVVQLVFEVEMFSLNNAGLSAVRRLAAGNSVGATTASPAAYAVSTCGGDCSSVVLKPEVVTCYCGRTHSK